MVSDALHPAGLPADVALSAGQGRGLERRPRGRTGGGGALVARALLLLQRGAQRAHEAAVRIDADAHLPALCLHAHHVQLLEPARAG